MEMEAQNGAKSSKITDWSTRKYAQNGATVPPNILNYTLEDFILAI